MKTVLALLSKDILLEWRQRYAFNGMMLYVVSTVFVVYLSYKLKVGVIDPITWNTFYWIILLFTAVNAVTKSFTQERAGRQLYYYQLAGPQEVILSKIIYNTLMLVVLAFLGLGIYVAMMGNPVQDTGLYALSVLLGCIGFSATLTLVAGIAAKADNTATLMAILSFPILLPMLLMLMRLSKNAIDGLARSVSYDEILTLLAIDGIVIAMSVLLFPYLWRS